ncbi:YihY/virulence factor BrkB family protein [Streptomyces sp. 8K308]|nr:YihY/virulence factor BrkB family protein [Streptomyces sp. 8K308]
MVTLTRLPWIGPTLARLQRTRVWHVYAYLEERNWTRLAAAITFTSFTALFPVLGLAAAIAAAVLSDERVSQIEDWFADQVPGISRRLDLDSLFDNADTLGLVSLLLVVVTGASWVNALRGCLRELWDLRDPPGNPLLRRAKDLGVLAGLGVITLLSLAVSGLALAVVRAMAKHGPGILLIQFAAYAFAAAVTSLLLGYVLTWLPGVRPPRRVLLTVCGLGAVGFELLKALLGGYLTQVATRNLYGAFGFPIALLIWINLLAKLLLVCCAWTAAAVTPQERRRADVLREERTADSAPEADDGDGTRRPPRRAPRDPPT